jgi:hypothetical protein
LALLAGVIVTSVPWTSHSVGDLPSLLTVADGYDIADHFMAWDNGEAVAELSGLDHSIRVYKRVSNLIQAVLAMYM